MLPQPAVRLGSNPIGASIQQLELDASSNVTKNAHHIIFDCIGYLSDQVKNLSNWHLAVNSAREVARMITKFNVQIIYTSPSEAFNYLRIFLDQLPSALIPESLFHITVEDKAFNERDSVSALKILPPHHHELLAAIVELLLLVEQSNIDDNDKMIFRQSIESSLFKHWSNTERALAIMSNIMTQFGSDSLASTEPLDRNISDCCEKIKAVMMKMKTIEQYFTQNNRRTRGAKAQLKLFDVKLTAVMEDLPSTKTLIDDYHLTVFDNYVTELNDHLASKRTNDLELVTKLPYMFNEVQKLFVAMNYHLDIFVHYAVQATGTDWSQNSELVQTLETLIVYHLNGSMKSFWCDNIGSDKVIVLGDVLREALCSSAKIDWTTDEINELMRLLDYFGTGFVTIFTFADLMRSFGNNVELIRQAINCPYFHGCLGKEGFKLLHHRAQGSYLLRFNKHLVIDYVDNGVQKSRRVVAGPSGFAQDVPNAEVYGSLNEFIASLSSELTTPFLRKDSIINLPGYCGLPASERKFVTDLINTFVFGFLHDNIGVEISCGLVQPAAIRSSIYTFDGEGWRPPFSSISYKSIEEALEKDFPMTKPYAFDHKVYQTDTERHLNAQEVSEEISLDFYLKQKKPVKIVHLSHLDIESTPSVDLLSAALLNNSSLTSVNIAATSQSARLVRVLNGHPNIRQLKATEIVANSVINDYIAELMASLPRLEKVIFDFASPDLLVGAIKATTLKVLQLDYMNERLVTALESLVTTNTSLTALHVMNPLGQAYNDSVLKKIGQLPLKELRIYSLRAHFGNHASFNNIEKLTLMDPQGEDLKIISTMENLKELRVFTDHNAIHSTSFVHVEQLYSIPQLKFCGMHHHVLCRVVEARPGKALFLTRKACGVDTDAMDTFIEILEEQPHIEYLSLRGYQNTFLNSISASLTKLQQLKALRLVDTGRRTDEIEFNSKFVNALAQLTSLRAMTIIGSERAFDEKEIIEKLPNLARFEIGGRAFGDKIHKLASPLLSIAASAIIHLHDSVTSSCAIRDARTGHRFRRHTRALRQRITDEIVDLIVIMHNIVRSPEALQLLPSEIWMLIFDGLNFERFLDLNDAFKKIAQNAPNVTRVVDWHDFLKRPEAWNLWS